MFWVQYRYFKPYYYFLGSFPLLVLLLLCFFAFLTRSGAKTLFAVPFSSGSVQTVPFTLIATRTVGSATTPFILAGTKEDIF